MRQAFRASVLHCLSDPGEESRASAFEYFEDGLLIVEDGTVLEAGNAESLLDGLAEDVLLTEFPGKHHCVLRRAAAGLAAPLRLPG